MKKKITLMVAGVAAATALTLSGCSGGGGNASTNTNTNPSGSASAASVSTLSIGTDFDKTGWEIGQSGSAFNAPYFSAVYDSLLLINSKSQPVGDLATSWDISSDELTYTFHLATGVTFTDGTTFDADVAVANLNYLEKGSQTSPAFTSVSSISKVDDTTIKVVLKQPDPGFLYNLGLGNSYMVSSKVLASPTYAQETTPAGGSGPYTLDASKSTAGQDYVFTKNPKSWEASKFPWSTVELHVIADPSAMANAMSTGQINVEFANYSASLKSTADSNGWTLTPVMSGWSGLMIADRAGTKIKALGDVRVRQAINMAFDRSAMVKASGDPKEIVSDQVFAKTDPSLDSLYPYDVSKAKQLLSEAGYPNGFSITMPSNSLFDSQAAIVKQALAAIGITVNVQELDPATYNQQVFAGNFPIYIAFLQLYGNPMKTINDFFEPGPSNPYNSAQNIPQLQTLLGNLHKPGADVDSIAQQINSYATQNAWFAVWDHGNSYYATVPGVSIKPVQGLYIPNLQQFLPGAE